MYDEILFHGSNKIRGDEIIDNQEMQVTIGDKHWLGNGNYYFEEEFYAYKWIVDMCSNRYKTQDCEILGELYLVLQCNVSTSKQRVLDLTKAGFKILYDLTYKEIKDKKELSKRFASQQVAEGVVINYMFNELDYSSDFDLVKAIFTFNRGNYRGVKSRLGYMPQVQICVKNVEIVKDIIKLDYEDKLLQFEYMLEHFSF